jgi:hypothetical protein
MSLTEAWQNIEQHVKSFAESAAQVIEQELPVVGKLAEQASANPAMVALLSAVHLPQAPELLAALADTINKIEEGLAAAKAAGQAEAQPPAGTPADPAAPAA